MTSMIFLFFCLDSDVYIEDKTEIKEYILEETGCLFTGSPLSPNKKEWYFGQVRFWLLIMFRLLSIKVPNKKGKREREREGEKIRNGQKEEENDEITVIIRIAK